MHHVQGTQAGRYEEGELVPLHWCVSRMSLLCRHKAPWWKDGQCLASGNGNYHMVLRRKVITDSGSRSEGACTSSSIHSECSVNTCWVPGIGQGWTENSKQAPAATFQPVWKKAQKEAAPNTHWDGGAAPRRCSQGLAALPLFTLSHRRQRCEGDIPDAGLTKLCSFIQGLCPCRTQVREESKTTPPGEAYGRPTVHMWALTGTAREQHIEQREWTKRQAGESGRWTPLPWGLRDISQGCSDLWAKI